MFEPNLENLSFERAVQLFKEWGFRVESGPRTSEVTLILEGAGHRTCSVCELQQLPEMAASVLRIRWQTGAMIAIVRDV